MRCTIIIITYNAATEYVITKELTSNERRVRCLLKTSTQQIRMRLYLF